MSEQQFLAEIQEIFSSLPKVFSRMREDGALTLHWPGIRAVLVDPEPLSPAAVQALFIVFSLRCSSAYCFVLHSLTLSTQGANKIGIEELARVFDMPECEPEHQRWSRLLKLAWLAHYEGPQREAADLLLRRECSEAEYNQIHAVYTANKAINSYTVDPPLELAGEPMLDTFPEELQSMVPEFVQFHMRSLQCETREQPVAAMCSVCRQVRSIDEQWYPYEAARKLLSEDTLFSHGLCEACVSREGIPTSVL